MKNTDKEETKPEVWLRGPVPGIPALLQPSAHALLQVREDIYRYTRDLPQTALWTKPVGRASVGFHLQHLTGVLDRMLTYAKANELSESQFEFLQKEGVFNSEITLERLLKAFELKSEEALEFFKTLPENMLTETRTVGRKKLPSTVAGLLFHAAEHAQRHVGQLLVTTSILKDR